MVLVSAAQRSEPVTCVRTFSPFWTSSHMPQQSHSWPASPFMTDCLQNSHTSRKWIHSELGREAVRVLLGRTSGTHSKLRRPAALGTRNADAQAPPRAPASETLGVGPLTSISTAPAVQVMPTFARVLDAFNHTCTPVSCIGRAHV